MQSLMGETPKTALHRYKATAWMSILVTRGGGATFFITAVLLFGQDLGFLSIALVDLFFAVIQGIILFLALQTEQPLISKIVKGFS